MTNSSNGPQVGGGVSPPNPSGNSYPQHSTPDTRNFAKFNADSPYGRSPTQRPYPSQTPQAYGQEPEQRAPVTGAIQEKSGRRIVILLAVGWGLTIIALIVVAALFFRSEAKPLPGTEPTGNVRQSDSAGEKNSGTPPEKDPRKAPQKKTDRSEENRSTGTSEQDSADKNPPASGASDPADQSETPAPRKPEHDRNEPEPKSPTQDGSMKTLTGTLPMYATSFRPFDSLRTEMQQAVPDYSSVVSRRKKGILKPDLYRKFDKLSLILTREEVEKAFGKNATEMPSGTEDPDSFVLRYSYPSAGGNPSPEIILSFEYGFLTTKSSLNLYRSFCPSLNDVTADAWMNRSLADFTSRYGKETLTSETRIGDNASTYVFLDDDLRSVSLYTVDGSIREIIFRDLMAEEFYQP